MQRAKNQPTGAPTHLKTQPAPMWCMGSGLQEQFPDAGPVRGTGAVRAWAMAVNASTLAGSQCNNCAIGACGAIHVARDACTRVKTKGQALFEPMMATASGQCGKSEENGLGAKEFVP